MRGGFLLSCCLLVGLAGAGLVSAIAAQTPVTPVTPVSPATKKDEKLIAFEMRGKPWARVFEWLSDQTGLPIISEYPPPTGSLDFTAPRIGNEPKKYTIAEVLDIINEGLLNKKFILLRRDAALTLVPADEKIDPSLLPTISLDQLPERGRTEIVKVLVPLQSLVAEDTAPEVKKMMGPFGEVVVLNKANQLLMQDKVATLREIVRTLKDTEDLEKGQAETYSHKCQFIRASSAETVLRNFLGDPRQVIEMMKAPQSSGNSGSGSGGPPFGPFGSRDSRDSSSNRPTTKIRMFYITSDDRTNTVHVNGPPDKIAQARAVMGKLDVPQPGQTPIAIGPPTLQTYPAPQGNAVDLVKTLQEIYKASPTLRISAVGSNQIMVWAGPEDQMEIAKHVQGVRAPAATTTLIPLSVLDATKLGETLKAMFGDSKLGAPFIEADAIRNAIVVKGSPEQVAEVKAAIQAIGENPAAQSGGVRIISLDKGSAATLADALEKLLPQMRDNPVKVIRPGGEATPQQNILPQPKVAPLPPPVQRDDDEEEQEPKGQLIDPKDGGKKPAVGNKNSPITITGFGNKLIVVSEDPQALALVSELVRLMTQTQVGEGDFEVIRLKNANAVDAARILDEAFNGPKQNNQGNNSNRGGSSSPGGSSGGFPFPIGGMLQAAMGAAGGSPGGPRVERIRVVADPANNSLLVKATPLDMLTIRNLITRAIDVTDNDSRAVIKTWMVGPLKYANANEVANIIREVYRESMNNNPAGARSAGGFGGVGFFGGIGGFSSSGRPQNLNIDANGNTRGVTLSVGVDDKTNSLILACPQPMYEDIKKLVEHLEKASSDSTQVVRVVPIKGIDPQLVQQALDAIQGKATPISRPSGGSGSFNPFSGSGQQGGGFQGGGGNPFGGGGGFQGGGGTRGGGTRGRGGIGPQSRGPDFFGSQVTDDLNAVPAKSSGSQNSSSLLFDPSSQAEKAEKAQGRILLTSAEQEAQPQPKVEPKQPTNQLPKPGEKAPDQINGPRLPVTAEALEELGVIVLRANNAADLEAALRIIDFIQKLGAGSEIDIQIVPLKQADATSVAHNLSLLFSRVIVGPNSTTAAPIQNQNRPQIQGGQNQFQGQQQGLGQQQQQNPQPLGGLVLIPLPRQNAILLASPKARTADVVREIHKLDLPVSLEGRATPFALKRASASRVSQLIQAFYADRFPAEQRTQHQIRVTFDDATNTVFVQAAPADLEEIRALIERIDTTVSSAINDLKVVPLRNAIAEDLAITIQRSIQDGFIGSNNQAGGVFPALGGGGGGLGGGQGGGLGGGGLGGGGLGGGGLGGGLGGGQQGQGRQTKVSSLRFLAGKKDGGKVFEAGILEDIRVNADARINALVISAPEKTMQLILALIRELDVVPQARSEINIFSLKRADATQLALTLQQLFLGSGGVGRTATGGGALGGGLPGQLGGGQLGGQLGGGVLGGQTAVGQQRPLQLTLGGVTPDGIPLIDLRLTVDERTNSLIVAGSRNDLDVIEAIIARLEDGNIQQRINEAYRLTSASAADVANALNDFVTKSLTVLQKGNQLTAFQELQRDVIIVPEPITNTLLISATPNYFADMMRIIQQLDQMPPQVMIQVLIADVTLQDNNEFGVELGLQTPVLFRRSITPAPGTGGTLTYTGPGFTDGVTGLIPPGVTVNNTVNPVALPGFNFNNVFTPLGNNPIVSPGVVGFQGLSNLGVGRVSPTSNVGGFVFSASSNTLSLLVRALKTQNRIEILSRPQIMTLDNQTALINVGRDIPLVTGTTLVAGGLSQQNIERRNVGIILQVTPKINPDGRVLMRVVPEVSSVDPVPVNLGNGNLGTALNVQHLETTVTAYDGETVALGGLLTRRDNKTENKVPWLGDLPGIGAMFRYRTQSKGKTELLVILTPHIVRSKMDADRILADESRKMDWVLGNVMKMHGPSGMGPVVDPGPGPEVMMQPGMPAPNSGVPSTAMPIEQAPLPKPLPPPVIPAPAKPLPSMPPAGAKATDVAPIMPLPIQPPQVLTNADNPRPQYMPVDLRAVKEPGK